MSETELPAQRAAALKRTFENAPYSKKLGVTAVRFELGRAMFVLDYAPENTTVEDIVHGAPS